MAKSVQKDYRQLVSELEKITTSLQEDDLDINQAIELFNQGQELVKQLEKYLKNAENTIKRLKVK